MLGLLITPVVEALDEEHPQDYFDGRGVAPEPLGVGLTAPEVGLHPLEEHIVIEQSIELDQLGFHLQLKLGHQLEEVYGIVASDYHDDLCSCGAFGA
jgi:hypothetical protein